MKTVNSIVLCMLVGLCAGRAFAAAAVQLDKDLACGVRVGLGTNVRYGYMLPIIVEFENAGEPRTIQVRTDGSSQVLSVFSVPAGRGVRRCLYVPVCTDLRYYGPDNVVFSDAASGRVLKQARVDHQVSSLNILGEPGGYDDPENALVGLSLSRAAALTINNDMLAPSTLSMSHALAGAGLPDSWLGYSGIDVIVIEYDAWAEAGFDKKPVVDWIAMGGICIIADAPKDARADVVRHLAAEAPFTEPPDNPAGDQSSPETCLVGMGGVAFVDKGFLAAPHTGILARWRFQDIANARIRTARSRGEPQIEGVDSPPFWSVLAALLVFACVVGPLGWWYLIKRKQRLLLYYVAAPALSLCAIVLTIGAAVLHEGLTPYVSCVGVRFIDQRVKKRIDLSQFGVYAPFGLGASLTGSATEVPHFLSHGDHSYSGSTFSSRPVAGGRKYEGVLPPRTQVWFGRELIELERRRLVVWEEDGRLFVENHLGCTLTDLVVRHDGQVACFASVPDGSKESADFVAMEDVPRHDQWIADQMARCFAPGKSRTLAIRRWKGLFGDGNSYVARADGLATEHVWLDSFVNRGADCIIFGAY